MKRLFALLICLTVIVSFPVLGSANNDRAVVNNPNPQDRLHLRKGPGASSASLGKYYNGTPVTILEYRDDGWLKVGVGNKEGSGDDIYQLTGYMMSVYLAKGSKADSVKSVMPEYMSTAGLWNLYSLPDKNSPREPFGYGQQVYLMGFTDAWWHVAVMKDEIFHTGFIPAKNDMKSGSTATVNNPNPKDRLHLRTDSNAAAQSLGKYYNGVQVRVLSFHGDGRWAKVRIGNTEGYMMSNYLAIGSDAGLVNSAIPTVRLTTDKVNLREKASLTSRALGQYARGTSVKVWGICGAWLHVEVGDKSGYMLASMLSALPGEGPGNTTPPVSGKAARLKSDANFRESAGYTGKSLAYLGKGTRVTVQSQSGDWYYVRIGTTEACGWILKSLVSIE